MAAMLARAQTGVVGRFAQQRAPLVGTRAGVSARRSPVTICQASQSPYDTEDVSKKLNEALANTGNFIQTKWEETEDKPAAVAVTLGALLALVAASSVVDAVDKIPIISDIIELVGVVVTGWFTYRYLVFGPDREELVSNIKVFLSKVYGK
jgi:hypothetical protein